MEALYYARRPFQYGNDPVADFLDLDQVFELRGEPNDERLARLGFVARVSVQASLVQCGVCGKRFTTDAALNVHGRKRHSGEREHISDARHASVGQIVRDAENASALPADDAEKAEEAKLRADERRLESERPIYWDKTAAAIQAGDNKPPEIITKSNPESPVPVKRKRGRPRKVVQAAS